MYRIIYHIVNKEIIQVLSVSDGFTAFDQNTYSLIQGDVDSILSQCSVLSINPQPFVEYLQSINVDTSQLVERIRVALKRAKGAELINRFIVENEAIEIDSATNIQILTDFMPLKGLLESGAMATTLALLEQMDSDAFILTPHYSTKEERKQSYIDEITQFITNLDDII